MKILSLELAGDIIYGYMAKGGKYLEFEIDEADKVTCFDSFEKGKHRDYEHFRGVIGKFDPYAIFIVPAEPVNDLTFVKLKNIIGEKYK